MAESTIHEKVRDANALLQEAKDKIEWDQKLFMRKARFGKGDYVSAWGRRMGKSFTLKKLVKPVFKREHKNFQCLNAVKRSRKHKVIKKDTKVLLVDECWDAVAKFIKSNRPDIRIVGLKTTWNDEESARKVEESFGPDAFDHIQFEK